MTVGGHVHLHRLDGNVIMLHRPNVRVLPLILVAQAAGQDMNNYEMPEYDAKNVDYSQDVVDAIGRDFEDIVRANPDAYGPQ